MALKKFSIPAKAPKGLEESWQFLNRLFNNFQRRLPRYRFMGGVQVERTSNQTISTNPSGGGTAVTWENTVYDDGDFWDGDDATRLTVPTGFDGRAYVSAGIRFAANATGHRYVRIRKNGSDYKGMPFITVAGSSVVTGLNVAGCMVDVDEGDYFEVEVWQDSGGDLDVLGDEFTWFHMILYEKSAK